MKKLFLSLALGFLVFGVSNAQDTKEAQHSVSINIPEVFVLDIEASGGETSAATVIDLTPAVPTDLDAGEIVEYSKTDASLTLNYTSIVASGETRSITVALNENLPAGIKLKLRAGEIMGGSAIGAIGNRTAEVDLTSTAKNVVTGIGTGYTGNGNAKGRSLSYTLESDANAFSSIVATAEDAPISRTVTYTITD